MTRRYGLIGLGLGVLGCLAPAGCGIGTDPSLQGGDDAAAGPDAAVDARVAPPVDAASSELPSGLPPIDEQEWAGLAIATFALG